MHVRAALRNGLTPDEIKEVLLQCAIYCGVPGGEPRVQGRAARARAARQRRLTVVRRRSHSPPSRQRSWSQYPLGAVRRIMLIASVRR